MNDITSQCDGGRYDVAMLMLNKVFGQNLDQSR
jgi:hypothetical protein